MIASIDILIDIIKALFIALTSACFVMFWDFCTGEPDAEGGYKKGRIFSFIGKWVALRGQIWDLEHPERLNPYKAMGVCPLCFSVYVSLAFTILAAILISMPWWYFLPVAVMSMRLVRSWM